MINTIKKSTKKWAPKCIKTITTLGTTILITLAVHANPTSAAVQKEIAEIFKKNPDKEIVVKVENNEQNTDNVEKFESLWNNASNALTFAANNVDQYYPDMKEHLTTMMNSFRDEEHRSATIKLLNEMVENISDPAQKTWAIIYALERRVFYKSDFAKKYDSQITDETFDYMDIFRVEYKKRFDVYYANLLANIEQLKEEIKQKEEQIKQKDEQIKQQEEEIKQKIQELENILNKFSSEDIKTNSAIKELTINTEKFYQEWGFPISDHLQSLFDATK